MLQHNLQVLDGDWFAHRILQHGSNQRFFNYNSNAENK